MTTTKKNETNTNDQQELLEQARKAREQADELERKAKELEEIPVSGSQSEITDLTSAIQELSGGIQQANNKLDKLLKPWNMDVPAMPQQIQQPKKSTLLGSSKSKSEMPNAESEFKGQYADEDEGGDKLRNIVIVVVAILVILIILFYTGAI